MRSASFSRRVIACTRRTSTEPRSCLSNGSLRSSLQRISAVVRKRQTPGDWGSRLDRAEQVRRDEESDINTYNRHPLPQCFV
eukprot:COSAG01_NODE_7559_length_3150_cov_1.656506_2_plen_82_part_00